MSKNNVAVLSSALTLEKSVNKGKLAEELAVADFKQNGFQVYRTGDGSDYFIQKRDVDGKLCQQFVEVKAGKARLSKNQKKKRRRIQKAGYPYFVYRVSDEQLNYHLESGNQTDLPRLRGFEGTFIIADPAICPHCRVEASGLDSIISLFGLRNMQDGTVRVQSWCVNCRCMGK